MSPLLILYRFSDFAENFSPRSSEYFKMLNARESINSDLAYNIKQVFTEETIRAFLYLLTLEIENEAAVEALR